MLTAGEFIDGFKSQLTPYEQCYVILTVFSRSLAWFEMARSWPYFATKQKVFPLWTAGFRPLIFFTCSSHYLSILYVVYPIIFGVKAPAAYAGLVFGVLCGVTIGFWVFVYDPADYGEAYVKAQKKTTKKQREASDKIKLTYPTYFFTDWVNHFPMLLIFSKIAYDAGEDAFAFENIWLAPAWGITWLVLIFVPWRMIGGDALYADLRDDKSFAHKAITVVKLIVITIVGFVMGHFLNDIFVESVMKVLDVVGVGEL